MPKPKKNIELNPKFKEALLLMENSKQNVFVTGRAGTGKSTLLQYFKSNTRKKVVLLAPTGVAAVNIGGQTIHSFFGFKPDITPAKARKKASSTKKPELYKKLDTVVVDEISMVRADLLDCMDAFLQKVRDSAQPFGGVQVVFIGDLYQLPPVVTSQEKDIFEQQYETPYFFSAHVFADLPMEIVELEKVYRQEDDRFVELLNSIRNRSITEDEIDTLNARHDAKFSPDDEDFYVYLTTINKKAAEINAQKLTKLPGKAETFYGHTTGNFQEKNAPAPEELVLKEGAQVMLVNNDPVGRWINGTMGTVVGLEHATPPTASNPGPIYVELEDGDEVEVMPNKWESFRYAYDSKNEQIETERTGSFTQYPLMLAWAVTIHKAQGKTFDNIVVDVGRGTFVHGQMYVALSRCTTLEGLVLKQPLKKSHILLDWRVVKFLTQYRYDQSEEEMPLEKKITILKKAAQQSASVNMVYLKANDHKSERTISPKEVGTMRYQGKTFPGVSGYCHSRKADRTFRVDRILELKLLDED